MCPLADNTVLITPMIEPKAAKRSMKVLTSGCWSLKTVVMVTATIIPVTRKMLNARLNLFSLIGSIPEYPSGYIFLSQIFLKLIGSLGSPCACRRIGPSP